jgi:hypothetical protein
MVKVHARDDALPQAKPEDLTDITNHPLVPFGHKHDIILQENYSRCIGTTLKQITNREARGIAYSDRFVRHTDNGNSPGDSLYAWIVL